MSGGEGSGGRAFRSIPLRRSLFTQTLLPRAEQGARPVGRHRRSGRGETDGVTVRGANEVLKCPHTWSNGARPDGGPGKGSGPDRGAGGGRELALEGLP